MDWLNAQSIWLQCSKSITAGIAISLASLHDRILLLENKLYRMIIKRNNCNYIQTDDSVKDLFLGDLFSQYFDMYLIAVFNILSSHVLVRM